MATLKTTLHTRSISLPPRPTALDLSIENQFCKLRASQVGPSSSSSICQNLCLIKDLYEQINNSIHLPQNQLVLSNDFHRGEVEEVLEGSLALLDISSCALDSLSQMKESILDLQSAIRRGSITEGIDAYVLFRKKIGKTLSKCLVNIKKAEKCYAMTKSGSNSVKMLKEALTVGLSILKAVFSYVMGKKAICQGQGWSLVAKLVKSKHVNGGIESSSEVEDLDRVLCVLSNKNSSCDTKVLLNQLETLEMAINDLHNEMDSVTRCIIKIRVSLLNVLN